MAALSMGLPGGGLGLLFIAEVSQQGMVRNLGVQHSEGVLEQVAGFVVAFLLEQLQRKGELGLRVLVVVAGSEDLFTNLQGSAERSLALLEGSQRLPAMAEPVVLAAATGSRLRT